MVVVYIGLASILLSLLMLWGVGKFRSRPAPKVDVQESLRRLLVDKAEGRISPEEFERRQAELHLLLLQSAPGGTSRFDARWLLVLLVPAIAALVYWGFAALDERGKTAPVEEFSKLPGLESKSQANSGGDLNTVVKRLADKMANDPQNGDGWLLLAKTYGELRRYGEAADAYAKAAAVLPADATLFADWADAHVMSQERRWDEAARKIIKRALAADPKHLKSLALAGSEAFDRGDYKAAIDFWKRMKAAAPPDSMDSKLADANIAEAVALQSGKKPAAAAPVPDLSMVAGVLTLDPKLRSKVGAQDTVFVTAKSPDGSGPPLAVKRFKGADLPIEFQLDDSAAIMPGRVISQFAEVQVSAKVSKTGDAGPQKGDIISAPVNAKLGAGNLKLELSAER